MCCLLASVANDSCPHINAGLLPGTRQRMDGHIRAGDVDVPTIGFSSARDHLGRALNGLMRLEWDAANFREGESPTIQHRAVAVVGRGEAAGAVAALEARIARHLGPLDPPEDCLTGLIQTTQHRLQDGGMDRAVVQASGVEVRRLVCLLRGGERDTAPLPGRLALFQSDVVACAAPALVQMWERAAICRLCARSVLPCLSIPSAGRKSGKFTPVIAFMGDPAFIPSPQGRGLEPTSLIIRNNLQQSAPPPARNRIYCAGGHDLPYSG
jgi:hypothetical protein